MIKKLFNYIWYVTIIVFVFSFLAYLMYSCESSKTNEILKTYDTCIQNKTTIKKVVSFSFFVSIIGVILFFFNKTRDAF